MEFLEIQSSAELIDMIKERARLTSDFKLAQALNWSHVRVSNYRREKSMPDDAALVRLAELAKIDPKLLIVLVLHYRAQDPKVRDIYKEIARSLMGRTKTEILSESLT